MKHTRVHVLAALVLACLALPSRGGKYAVLVSAEYTFVDNEGGRSDFWYTLALAYETLINHGFSHNNITVLYNYGEDFESKYAKFQNVWACENGGSITDFGMDSATFDWVMDSLGQSVVNGDDTLVIWWTVGHGEDKDSLGHEEDYYHAELKKRKNMDTAVVYSSIFDTTLARLMRKIEHYKLREILWSTCNSGGLIDGNEESLASESTVVLTATTFHNGLGTYKDTLPGAPGDTVKYPAFSAFLCHLVDWHDLRGRPYNHDVNANGYVELSEIRAGVDSLYGTPLYYQAYGNPLDTVQISDTGGIASSTRLVERSAPRALTVRYNGQPLMRITNGGYCYLKGTAGTGSPSGLRFGPSISLSTSGNLTWGDTLLPHQEAWFDSLGDVTGGLLYRSNCGERVHHISSADTVRTRGWLVESFAEFQ